jgi:putative membrane protein
MDIPAQGVTPSPADSLSPLDSVGNELAARRTGMAFQRTRMAADRTLMAVIRTSLSLIGFGFTIFQVFQKLHDAGVLKARGTARNFGETLVVLGIGMLLAGIGFHIAFMRALRGQRQEMKAEGLIHAESPYPPSLTLIVAVLLLLVGIAAVIAMATGGGPLAD